MAPYSSAELAHYDNDDDDGYRTGHGQNNRTTDLGFTAPLIESISTFKSKLQHWAEHEKSKADSRVESYHNSLVQQQTIIDSQVSKLTGVQRERGMNDMFESKEGKDNNDNDENHPDNIASRKKSLEEQSAKVQIEIMKLKNERDNRENRVQDIALEELKQRIRANDATALKRTAEESKNTTIDDLTRGVVNYNKLGLNFTETGREGRLKFSFTQLDPDDPSRTFSFVLFVNDEEKYDVVDYDQNIDKKELAEILEELNESECDDLSILVRNMRRVFKHVCEHP